MTGDNDTSFDPKTWLDPKPKDSDQNNPDKPIGPDEPIGFDPKTWVGPIHGNTNAGDNDLGAKAETSASSKNTILSIAGACVVTVGAIGASVWLLSGSWDEAPADNPGLAQGASSDTAGQTSDGAGAVASEESAPYPGRQQLLSVSGYQGLIQSLVDLGVPATEANGLGRDVVAGLGTDGEEWRVEMWVSDKGKESAVEFLSARLASGNGVELTRRPDASFEREDFFSEVQRTFNHAKGEMGDHDFYTVAVNSGIPDSLATEFAKVFSFDFSFADEVKAGDEFEAMWETQVDERGDEVAPPRLVYARMVTAKGEREYFAFTPPGEIEAQWFSPEGLANVRSLLRTPVDGARISSKFGFRNHPIRKQRIRHGGVDFAAPTGTPVYASGDSTVQVRRFSRSAGNMVVLDHGDGMVTRYFHLNAFADGLEIGKSVRQGETIGYVGSTGASTGPHLHYEIIVNGEKLDPLTFDTSTVEPLTGDGVTMFSQHRNRLQSELD